MKIKKWIVSFSLLLLLMGMFPGSALAKSKKHTDKVAPPADFLVQPILPKNNIGGQRLGYFNLKNSTKKRTLEIKVFNTTKYPLKVNAELVNATTMNNGVVDYNGQKAINKKLLKNPGTNYLSSAKSVTVPAEQTGIVKVKVKSTDFTGTKATAINLIGTPDNQKGSIANKYIYAIGIVMNGKTIKKQDLHKLDVKSAALNDDRDGIKVKIANPDATYLMNGTMDISFHSAKRLVFQYHKQREKMKIAPKSDFNFTIPFRGQRLVPGAYKLAFRTKNDRYTQTTDKYVEITKDKVRFITKNEYELVRRRSMFIVILILLIIVGVAGYFVYRRKKNNEEPSEEI